MRSRLPLSSRIGCAPIFTARKRSLRRLCFYTCLSVILFTGGCLGPHPRERLGGLAGGVSRPTPRGRLWGLAGVGFSPTPGGVSRPTPGGCPGPHPGGSGPWGCIPACTEADPPSIRLLLRAVRILMECILVAIVILIQSIEKNHNRNRVINRRCE